MGGKRPNNSPPAHPLPPGPDLRAPGPAVLPHRPHVDMGHVAVPAQPACFRVPQTPSSYREQRSLQTTRLRWAFPSYFYVRGEALKYFKSPGASNGIYPEE